MASPTINGLPLLGCRLTLPRVGVWTGEATHDGTAALSGRVTLDLDGATFVGTVSVSKVEAGKVITRFVGGAGGLTRELDARAYAGTTLSAPLADILRETAESLSGAVSSADLAVAVPTWQRVRGPASGGVAAIADKAGLSWRVMRDGTVWLGRETWPETTAKPVELDANWSDGSASFSDGIALEPGTTYAGNRIEQVVHSYARSKVITEASTESPSGLLNGLLDVVRRELDFAKAWRCVVISQHSDGTLELLPDSPRIRGRGIDKVRISPGLAGAKIQVPAGAACFVAFDGGDPSKPFVLGWESETGMTLTTIGDAGSAQFVALANLCDSNFSAINNWMATTTFPTGVGPSGTTIVPAPTMQAVACTKLKAS
jgi:hypothetical protein